MPSGGSFWGWITPHEETPKSGLWRTTVSKGQFVLPTNATSFTMRLGSMRTGSRSLLHVRSRHQSRLCDYAGVAYYYAGVDVLAQAVSRHIGTTASGTTNEEEQKLATFKELMEKMWDKGPGGDLKDTFYL